MGRLSEAINSRKSSSKVRLGSSSGGSGEIARVRKEMGVWLKKVWDAETRVSRTKTHLRKGGRVIRKEMRRIIKSEANNKRKKTGYYREGELFAEFFKGNLFRSIKVMTFKRSWSVFVGPKYSKIKNGGYYFNEKHVNAYYARWVNDGTKHFNGIDFINRAKIAKEKEAREKIITSIKEHLGVEARKKGLK